MNGKHVCHPHFVHSPNAKAMNAFVCGCITEMEYRFATDPIAVRDREIARLRACVDELEFELRLCLGEPIATPP
jgi:hypothetical protein